MIPVSVFVTSGSGITDAGYSALANKQEMFP
jgi:hypothetical protein